ncbi:hypothetical protein MPSEU_000756500 [Mayamaea pseudoterrestris]|nr:hypothetical protein MPSEU_000756500 [Mayamaea pseudoterrestris]
MTTALRSRYASCHVDAWDCIFRRRGPVIIAEFGRAGSVMRFLSSSFVVKHNEQLIETNCVSLERACESNALQATRRDLYSATVADWRSAILNAMVRHAALDCFSVPQHKMPTPGLPCIPADGQPLEERRRFGSTLFANMGSGMFMTRPFTHSSMPPRNLFMTVPHQTGKIEEGLLRCGRQ